MTDSISKWRLLCVAGARPNFVKIAPLLREMRKRPNFEARLLHTGQHYDERLSKVFFEDLAIPKPDLTMGVGSASHAVQTARIMEGFEPVLEAEQPHAVVVVGDVNSTLACAVVAAKFQRRESLGTSDRRRPLVVHVEAGLRSMDDDMPEEINRRLTDSISDVLLVSDPAGLGHLKREGVPQERVTFVGNVMIDTLVTAKGIAKKQDTVEAMSLDANGYLLVTLHRPSNVDDPKILSRLLRAIEDLDPELPCVFPIHPRTRQRLGDAGIELDESKWRLTEPLGYFEFLRLQMDARAVLTDSGGVQEETTVLGVPCMTVRDNTERPVTIHEGTNVLAGTDPERFADCYREALKKASTGRVPEGWDGHAAVRVVDALERELNAFVGGRS